MVFLNIYNCAYKTPFANPVTNGELKCIVLIAAFPILNSSKTDIPAVVEAIEKKDYSIEITKADISVMCQHSGGEEETEVMFLHAFISSS